MLQTILLLPLSGLSVQVVQVFGITLKGTLETRKEYKKTEALQMQKINDYIEYGRNSIELNKMLEGSVSMLETVVANSYVKLFKNAIEREDILKVSWLISPRSSFRKIIFEKGDEGEYANYYELLNFAVRKRKTKIVIMLLDLEGDSDREFRNFHASPGGKHDSLLWENESTELRPKEELLQVFGLLVRECSAEALREVLNSNENFYVLIEHPKYMVYLFVQAMGYYNIGRNFLDFNIIPFANPPQYAVDDVIYEAGEVNYEVIEEIVRILQIRAVPARPLPIYHLAHFAIMLDNERVLRLLLDSGLVHLESLVKSLKAERYYSLVASPGATKLLLRYPYVARKFLRRKTITSFLFNVMKKLNITDIPAIHSRANSAYDDKFNTIPYTWFHSFSYRDEWIKNMVANIIESQRKPIAAVNKILEIMLNFDAAILYIIDWASVDLGSDFIYRGLLLTKVREVYRDHELVRDPVNRYIKGVLFVMNKIRPALLWHYIGGRYRVCLDNLFISGGRLPIKLYRDKILKHPKWIEWKEIIEIFILCMNRKITVKDGSLPPIPSELFKIISLHGVCQTFDASYGWAARIHFPLLKALHRIENARYAKVEKLCKS